MKAVSSSLKLDLAQYHEMQTFAQFGSDLDASTKKILNHGEKVTELLKQPQYQPMPAQEQVASLYAGTRGFMDDVPVDAVLKFEGEMIEFLRNSKADVLNGIAEKKVLDDDLEGKLKAAIEEFKKGFRA